MAMASVDQTTAECSELVSMMDAINNKVREEADRLGKPLIQKVPEPLRSIEHGAEYFNPKIVAIGPYHRHDPQVQAMEEIKKAAARDLCNSTSHSVQEFYAKVREVAGEARSCYADRFDDMSEKEFADMMFFDGCFLLEFIAWWTDDVLPSSSLGRWLVVSRVELILSDLMLFENQIPWMVLEALMSLRPVRINQFAQLSARTSSTSDIVVEDILQGDEGEGSGHKPWHLLDLVRDRYLGPDIKKESSTEPAGLSIFTSATDLAEVGVRIRASKTLHFRGIRFHRDLLFGWLSLPPILIDNLTQVVITNMVAFERCSFLSLLAILMSGKEDVKELRSKRIMCSDLSDRQTLHFFESLYPHVIGGASYLYVLRRLNDYYRNRRVRVLVHKFIYNNFQITLGCYVGYYFLHHPSPNHLHRLSSEIISQGSTTLYLLRFWVSLLSKCVIFWRNWPLARLCKINK